MTFTVELEQEVDGRWIAKVMDIPGVLAYGQDHEKAFIKAQALALHALVDKLEHGELASETTISFKAA